MLLLRYFSGRDPGMLTTIPCPWLRPHTLGARPAPEVKDYEGGDLVPNGGTAQLLGEAGSERWWREHRNRGVTDVLGA